MIYRCPVYLDFITKQLLKWGKADGWDVSCRIIANDPTPQIESLLPKVRDMGVNVCIYNDHIKNDYYLNRVYRCWNTAGFTSKKDNICFVNSDMAFSPGWLDELLKYHDGKNIPCSQLVESGRLPSKKPAFSYNFGRTPEEYQEEDFLKCVPGFKSYYTTFSGGLYMPVVFETQRFKDSYGFPEGNIYSGGVGKRDTQFVMSGDAWYFKKLEKEYGMKHITLLNSIVYHIQEGEMRG